MTASLDDKLQFLRPGAVYVLRDDGAGPYIATWVSGGAQPTQQEIDAVNDAAAEAAAIDRRKDAVFNRWNTADFGALIRVFYEVDKRLRVLEAKPAITLQQFKNGLKALLT